MIREISIHAPRTGRDIILISLFLSLAKFQSTRPVRGATAGNPFSVWIFGDFNPRAPYGARPDLLARRFPQDKFQSTRPVRGATANSACPAIPSRDFNPRAPYGARRRACHVQRLLLKISIHAPRTGRDKIARKVLGGVRKKFQSTRPVRGATDGRCPKATRKRVFQSTRPVRGATTRTPKRHTRPQNFNPRAPYGARRVRT